MRRGWAGLALVACTVSAQAQQMGAGTQDRKWLPEQVRVDNSQQQYPVETTDGVCITARDGIKLDAKLFRPIRRHHHALQPFRPVASEVTGYPYVSLWASSDTNDGDMVFSLDDVAPDGSSHQVVQGYLNVPHQRSPSAPMPLVPNQA